VGARKGGIAENLSSLDFVERSIRDQSIAAIQADEALLDHVDLIEGVMDHLD
jgi:hypothetical protein